MRTLNEIKLGFTLLKYGYKIKQNIVMIVIFLLIGLATEIGSKGSNMIGAFYLMLVGIFGYQMIISMDLTGFVQSSYMKKAIQTKVPVAASFVINVVMYTIIVLEKWFFFRGDEELFTANKCILMVVGALLFVEFIYMGICYKYYALGTILFCMCAGFVGGANVIIAERFMPEIQNTPYSVFVIGGYAVIILGTFIQYGLSVLLYKKDLSKFAFRGIATGKDLK